MGGEKETFWRQMDQELRAIPEGERVIVGGYLNGHVGISREAIERIHGGWGVGEKNEEGERVTDFGMAFDLSIVNTFFEKETKPSCDLQEWRKTKSDRLLNV